MQRLFAIARKEVLHILRDRRTLVIMLLMPLVQLFLLGYAATTTLEHITTAVLDEDHSPQSRALIEQFRASAVFMLDEPVATEAEIQALMDRGTVRAALLIPAGFGTATLGGRRAAIALIVDGSDPTVANTILASAQAIAQAYNLRALESYGISRMRAMPLELRPRVWYNPALRSVNFMVPASMALILFVLTMMLTALSIVRERERGLFEQLLVTPVRPLELIVGKILPYIVVALFDVLEVLALGVFWFRIDVHGSVTLLVSLAVFFLLTPLGLGLLISTLASTQQEAMMLAWFITLPAIFLGGFMFPIEAMPPALQLVSRFIPLRYMLHAFRAIVLKGVGLELLWPDVRLMAAFGAAVLLLAATRLRRYL